MATIVIRLEATLPSGERIYQEADMDRSLYTPAKLASVYTDLAANFDAYVKAQKPA